MLAACGTGHASGRWEPPLAPCAPVALEAVLDCPDERHRALVSDAGTWCECPRLVDGPGGGGTAAPCGVEFVSIDPEGRYPYERPRACP